MTNLEEIGARIRELRWARGIPIDGRTVSRGHLSRIECGRQEPSIEMMERLSGLFGVGLEVLLGDEERFYGSLILEDDWVQAVRPFLKLLNMEQKTYVLKVLAAAPVTPRDGRREKRG